MHYYHVISSNRRDILIKISENLLVVILKERKEKCRCVNVIFFISVFAVEKFENLTKSERHN